MILIITHKEDYTSDFIINKLNQRKIKYKRLNCEDLINSNFKVDKDLNFSIDGINLFNSVWFRRTKLPDINSSNPQEDIYLLNEYETLLKNLFCTIDAKWFSDPFKIYKAENKLYQLKIAKNIGFIIPNTLITNNKETLKEFYFLNSKEIIIKPLSQSKLNNKGETEFIFTNDLKNEHIETLDEYELTPCMYQEKIQKSIELRVTVVGEKIFTSGINSQLFENTKTDWRKGKQEFFKETIPLDVEEKCKLIVKKLGLRFGAIDLIKDTNGNYVFLEINPNGQWAWIENETGLKISDAIINELI